MKVNSSCGEIPTYPTVDTLNTLTGRWNGFDFDSAALTYLMTSRFTSFLKPRYCTQKLGDS